MSVIKGWKGTWVATIDTRVGSGVTAARFVLERVGPSTKNVSVDITNLAMKAGDSYRIPFPVLKGSVIEFEVETGPSSSHAAIAAINLDTQSGKAVATFVRPFPL